MGGKVKKYINREISWLSFNERVLQEACDKTVPLIERLKFMGIFSSNQDEFFRVRVGTLMRIINAGLKPKAIFGATPKTILNEIHKTAVAQRAVFDDVFSQLYRELGRSKIFVINENELDDKQDKFVQEYFAQRVRPTLVPLMLDSVPQFPYLKNQVIYLAIHMSRSDKQEKARYALIEVPADLLPRFIVLPKSGRKWHIIMLDDIIRYGLNQIFSIFNYDTFAAYTIKLTRDAELDIEDDITKSTFEKISKSVRQREWGQTVRFVYDRAMPRDLLDSILKGLKLTDFENVIPGARYHNAKDFMNFPNVGAKRLIYRQRPALKHPHFAHARSLFEVLRKRDVLLHFPYQSFDNIIDLLREAAIDPKVKSISMTLYRVAKNSNVVNALINAIRNGKEVSVMMELQARFDEEANIYWTRRLEEEGAHVLDTVPGLKVHSKLCLITREEDKQVNRYAIVGTGNFNESTARIYSDHAFFTSDKRITKEIHKVFSFLAKKYKTYPYKHLMVAPFDMRKKFYRLINNETKNAKAGKEAYILVKLNSLVDQDTIQKLYRASQAGVKIKMVIRGICSLVPKMPNLSENIEVYSIVDKYLEHSRIFIFCAGGNPKYYISSGDWMVRNLDNRVEVAVPIYDPSVQKELHVFMDTQLNDCIKSRIIDNEQNNRYRRQCGNHHPKIRAQDDFYDRLKATLTEADA